jgi:hypothetical protein
MTSSTGRSPAASDGSEITSPRWRGSVVVPAAPKGRHPGRERNKHQTGDDDQPVPPSQTKHVDAPHTDPATSGSHGVAHRSGIDGFTNAITRDHADSTVLAVAAPNVHSRQCFMP